MFIRILEILLLENAGIAFQVSLKDLYFLGKRCTNLENAFLHLNYCSLTPKPKSKI